MAKKTRNAAEKTVKADIKTAATKKKEASKAAGKKVKADIKTAATTKKGARKKADHEKSTEIGVAILVEVEQDDKVIWCGDKAFKVPPAIASGSPLLYGLLETEGPATLPKIDSVASVKAWVDACSSEGFTGDHAVLAQIVLV